MASSNPVTTCMGSCCPASWIPSFFQPPAPTFDYDEIDDVEFENLLSGNNAHDPFAPPRPFINFQDFWHRVASLFRRDGRSTGGITIGGGLGTGGSRIGYQGVPTGPDEHGHGGGGVGGHGGNGFRGRNTGPATGYDFEEDDDEFLAAEEAAQMLSQEEIRRLTGKVLDEKSRREEEEAYQRAQMPVADEGPLIDLNAHASTDPSADLDPLSSHRRQTANASSSSTSALPGFTTISLNNQQPTVIPPPSVTGPSTTPSLSTNASRQRLPSGNSTMPTTPLSEASTLTSFPSIGFGRRSRAAAAESDAAAMAAAFSEAASGIGVSGADFSVPPHVEAERRNVWDEDDGFGKFHSEPPAVTTSVKPAVSKSSPAPAPAPVAAQPKAPAAPFVPPPDSDPLTYDPSLLNTLSSIDDNDFI
ncbi:hypothetical protein HDU76_013728 [Blyttiomyces sp. JEL0837]|nr:hypothetical protein HDU76_013728 [Blyttiomyces sp. JEL0837]